MPAKRHIMHGRDHCPGGADPIPCLQIATPAGSYSDLLPQIIPVPFGYWPLQEASGNAIDYGVPGGSDCVPVGTPAYQEEGPNENDLAYAAGFLAPASTNTFTDDHFVQSPATVGEDANTFTIFAWIYPQTPPAPRNSPIMSSWSSFLGPGWHLYLNTISGRLDLMTGNGSSTDNCFTPEETPIPVDEWTFVVATREVGVGKKIYANGAEIATATAGPEPTGIYPLRIGSWQHGGAEPDVDYFYGRIAGAGFIPDYVLPAADVAVLYEAGIGGVGGLTGGVFTIIDAKGDLIVGTSDDTANRLPVGTDGQLLSAYSDTALGVSWIDPPAGGGGGAGPSDTQAWMPLTTVTGGVPDLVWDGDDQLIPTLTTI